MRDRTAKAKAKAKRDRDLTKLEKKVERHSAKA